MKKYVKPSVLTSALAIVFVLSVSQALAASTAHSQNTNGGTPHQQQNKKILPATRGVAGTVSAISGTTLTVEGKGENAETYAVDGSKARAIGPGIQKVSDISVGDSVSVIGTVSAAAIAAQMILVQPAHSPAFKGFETLAQAPQADFASIKGVVAAISANTITVTGSNGKTYAVGTAAATITNAKHKKEIFSSVKIGDMVIVSGKPGTAPASITARSVVDDSMV